MRWLIIILLFVSCSSEKRIAKARDTLNKYDAGSGYCSVMFPCLDSSIVIETVKYDTVTVAGETFVVTETVNDTVYITKFLPGKERVITKTVTKDSIVYRRDNARESVLQSQVSQLTKSQDKLFADRDKYKSSAGKWRGSAMITWGILLAFIVGWIVAKIARKK